MGVQRNLPGKSSWKEGCLSPIMRDEADFGKKGGEEGDWRWAVLPVEGTAQGKVHCRRQSESQVENGVVLWTGGQTVGVNCRGGERG